MKKYVVDTNILYGLVFNESRSCNIDNVLNILNGNTGLVTYGTLFEAFDRYDNQKESLLKIMKFLNNYNFEVAGHSKRGDELFWELIYREKELSDFELKNLRNSLIEQTSDYVSGLLSQILTMFAYLYMIMHLDKIDNAYNAYIRYSDYMTNSFSHFPLLVKKTFEKRFVISYTQEKYKKFSNIIRREFWGIIRGIETHYIVLSGKPEGFIIENDFKEELVQVTEKFDRQYNETNYLDFMKKSYEKMETGEKLLSNCNKLFSYISCQDLTPLETDFINYYLLRLFVNQGKFTYNDIIDFMNLSTAFKWADGIITCDKKFLKKTMVKFRSINDSDFYKNSLQIFDIISN